MISFPEENPNIVIESNLQGEVVYVNPAFRKHFPDAKPDIAHPFLRDLHARLADFERKKRAILTMNLRWMVAFSCVESLLFQSTVWCGFMALKSPT